MSDGKAPHRGIFDVNLCSQCMQPFSQSAPCDARHAVPCGHIFCKDCLGQVESEQKSGRSVCRSAGCERVLADVSEFAPAWSPRRAARIRTELEARFRDQGDAGDRLEAPKEAEEAGPSLCAQHSLPFQAVETITYRPMCADCQTSVESKVPLQTFDEALAVLEALNLADSTEIAKRITALAEPAFTPAAFCDGVAKWGAEETARIRAWEEPEVKHVQAVASETVQVVQEVCARRIEVSASVLTQRAGLRASLEEFDQALADLPSDLAARLSKKRAVYAERKRLCDLLAGNMIAVPWAWAINEWANLPALSTEFDQKGAGGGGVLANAVLSAAKATLDKARNCTPTLPPPAGLCKFPVIPELSAFQVGCVFAVTPCVACLFPGECTPSVLARRVHPLPCPHPSFGCRTKRRAGARYLWASGQAFSSGSMTTLLSFRLIACLRSRCGT